MPGLQGIDTDYSPLTQGNEALTEDQSIKPINTPDDFYKGLQSPLLPYLSSGDYSKNITPLDRELITQASTSSQDIQKSVADIQKPNTGIMLLLGAIGGPNAVNEYYSRSMQKQIEPIVGNINLQYRQALNSGDFEGAQKLVNQLAPLVQYSPTAGKLYESFTNEIAKRQDNVQQNKIVGNAMLQAVRPGSPAERFYKNPANYLMDKQQFDKMAETFKEAGQVIGGVWTTTEGLTGRPIQQYPMAEATKATDIPKPTQDAIIKQLGPEYIPEYARLQTLVSTGKASNGEILAFNALNKAIGGQAAQNIMLQQLPPGERAKLNLLPGQAEQMLSPEGTVPTQPPVQSTQQPRQQGKVSRPTGQPSTGQASTNNIEQQRVIFDVNEMVRTGLISNEQGVNILASKGIKVSTPQGPAPQGVYQEARQQQTAAETEQTRQKAITEHQAEAGYKPQPQLLGYKVDKNGHLLQSPPGMSVGDLTKENWHVESIPDNERKGLVAFSQFQGMYEHVKNEVLTNPVFKEPEKYKAWWDIAKTYIQQGVQIPFTSINVGGMALGSEDRQYLASALATMGQMVETMANPSLKDNAAIGALKNYITSPNAKPSGIIAALDAVHDTALAGVKGIVGTTKGAVEEGVSPRDIKRERESKQKEIPVESAPSESTEPGTIRKKKGPALDIDKLEGAKGRLDRSKFKPVGQ